MSTNTTITTQIAMAMPIPEHPTRAGVYLAQRAVRDRAQIVPACH